MKRATILIAMLFVSFCMNAQNYKIGKWYVLSRDEYISYKYTVSYHKTDGGFETTYKIVDPRITVIAVNDTVNKKITVTVKETGGGIFAEINKQEYNYSDPELKPSQQLFGIEGNYRQLGGDRIPNQLALKYVSKKMNYVNVVSVLGDYESYHIEFFCF